jgi:hypothetical protein
MELCSCPAKISVITLSLSFRYLHHATAASFSATFEDDGGSPPAGDFASCSASSPKAAALAASVSTPLRRRVGALRSRRCRSAVSHSLLSKTVALSLLGEAAGLESTQRKINNDDLIQ